MKARGLYLLLLFLASSCARPQPETTMIEQRIPVKKSEVVVIDPGHGGKDSGSANKTSGYEEKSLTLETAMKTKEFLEEIGYTVIMTRTSDEYIPLKRRAEIANESRADLFVSIHFNHCPSREAHGIEIFVYKEKTPHTHRIQDSHYAAEQLSTHVVKYTGMYTRGTKLGNLAVIRETKMPAVLIEGGFLSNPSEREKIKDPRHRANLAWGIAKGVDHYFSLKRAQKNL